MNDYEDIFNERFGTRAYTLARILVLILDGFPAVAKALTGSASSNHYSFTPEKGTPTP